MSRHIKLYIPAQAAAAIEEMEQQRACLPAVATAMSPWLLIFMAPLVFLAAAAAAGVLYMRAAAGKFGGSNCP